MNAEIDETLKRIESTHKSVAGVLVCNKDGIVIRSTFSDGGGGTGTGNSGSGSDGQSGNSTAGSQVQSSGQVGNSSNGGGLTSGSSCSAAILQIIDKAKEALKDNDELTFVKIKTKKNEFIVVPDKDFMLITLLNSSDESTA